MTDFLNHTFIGYSPVLNKHRGTLATRMSFVSQGPEPASPAQAYRTFREYWPDTAGPLVLDCGGIEPEPELITMQARKDIWLEVPAAMTATDDGRQTIAQLAEGGFELVLRGRSEHALDAQMLGCFRLALIDLADDRRVASRPPPTSGQARSVPFALLGVTSVAQMERSFECGAEAIVGWPFDDVMERAPKGSKNSSFATIAKLLEMANAQASPDLMEEEVSRDPSLAFRLLRFLNSPGFGLRVEVQSFQHALMMLGYPKLRKWLALMLTTAAQDPNLVPVMFASLRRGYFIQRLAQSLSGPEAGDEAFILGVFSLLDKLFGEPFSSLFERLQIPDGVREALVDNTGPYMPFLKIAQRLELSPSQDIDDLLSNSFIELGDCNRFLVDSLIESGSSQTA